jgi:hypothetical protein
MTNKDAASEWQIRVAEEKEELDQKLERLSHFLKTEGYTTLKMIDRQLLEQQQRVMKEYSGILALRIDQFKEKGKS